MFALTLEEGIETLSWNAFDAFRTRDNMSAIGSVMVMEVTYTFLVAVPFPPMVCVHRALMATNALPNSIAWGARCLDVRGRFGRGACNKVMFCFKSLVGFVCVPATTGAQGTRLLQQDSTSVATCMFIANPWFFLFF